MELYEDYIVEAPKTSDAKIQEFIDGGFTHYVSAIVCTTVIIVDFVKDFEMGEDESKLSAEMQAGVKSLGWEADIGAKTSKNVNHKKNV